MTIAEFTPRLRNRIAWAIQESGKSQTQLADEIHTSQPVISRWVRGTREPSTAQLVALAKATGQLWLLDLRSLAIPNGGDDSSTPPPSNVSDLGERRSTCIPKSAGQKVRSVAA